MSTRPATALAGRADVRTIYLLKRAETAVRAGLEAALSDLGITPGQYTTLTLLRTRREVSSAELARQAGVTPQTMSETIALLERRGWIERGEHPANRRIQRLGLRAAGAELVRKCDSRVDAMETALFANLNSEEQDLLRESLGSLIQAAADFHKSRCQADLLPLITTT